jgi:hypothetical protein
MKRHWSFIVCDPRYLYPLAGLVLAAGVIFAFVCRDATMLNRFGSLIIGTGVWMSMRYTLREGINRVKNYSDNFPVIPGTNQLNIAYINKGVLAIGDAQLQVHGFVLVLVGSIVGSFGDLAMRAFFPVYFIS